MGCPSHCSQHQAGLMSGECPMEPIILNARFQLWNMEADPWWFGQQYLGILIVLQLLRMAELLPTDYMNILGNQVHPMDRTLFLNNDAILQDDNSPPHTARSVQPLFEGHEDSLYHLPWPAQSPDLNTIEPLLSVLEQITSSISSQETKRCSTWRVVQHSSSDCLELPRVYSKNDTSYITGKWGTNSISIKKCVSFRTVSIT